MALGFGAISETAIGSLPSQSSDAVTATLTATLAALTASSGAYTRTLNKLTITASVGQRNLISSNQVQGVRISARAQ